MTSPQTSPNSPSFEQSLAALEQIVQELEEGKLGLAESLAKYEAGVKHLKTCFGQLENAERKIELLTGIDAAGNPVTQPFDDTATAAREENTGVRSRKGAKGKPENAEKVAKPRAAAEDAIDESGGLF